ncbi:hypothetical protein SB717_36800, partial [Priestia sp. SIMBA_032]
MEHSAYRGWTDTLAMRRAPAGPEAAGGILVLNRIARGCRRSRRQSRPRPCRYAHRTSSLRM